MNKTDCADMEARFCCPTTLGTSKQNSNQSLSNEQEPLPPLPDSREDLRNFDTYALSVYPYTKDQEKNFQYKHILFFRPMSILFFH